MIDIKGLDKAKVLVALHRGTRPLGLGVLSDREVTEAEADAVRAIGDDGYVDYFAGRPIKVDFRGDEIDPRMYDRDAGSGAAERVIASLR